MKICLCGNDMIRKWNFVDPEHILPSEEEWVCTRCGIALYYNQAYGYEWYDNEGYSIDEELYNQEHNDEYEEDYEEDEEEVMTKYELHDNEGYGEI